MDRALGRPGQVILLLAGLALVLNPGPRFLPEAKEPPRMAQEERDRAGLPEVDWMTLGQLDYETGSMSAELSALVGTEVTIPGFMVPLDDFSETVSEFLLVPYFGACVHTPPPPPNQLVFVRSSDPAGVPVEWWDPVWIRGTLELDPEESVYGVASWSMVVEEIEPYVY